jgi:hypothetical protein
MKHKFQTNVENSWTEPTLVFQKPTETVDYYPVYRTLDTSTNQLFRRNKETAGAIQTLTDALHNQLHHRHSVGESAECENPRRNSSQQTLE